jgi:hypothetical protein
MENGSRPLRSVAAELALLFLGELESRVADDPELLVSTEAVLSFAAIRNADPAQWEHWQAILDKYEKSDLIDYMLSQPVRAEDPEWESKADRLIRLALRSGLELFHDPDQKSWASVPYWRSQGEPSCPLTCFSAFSAASLLLRDRREPGRPSAPRSHGPVRGARPV